MKQEKDKNFCIVNDEVLPCFYLTPRQLITMLVDENGPWSNFVVDSTPYDLRRSIMFTFVDREQLKKRLQGVYPVSALRELF